MPHAPTYSSWRITLIGDAAHGSTSHAGAGSGIAVEDALILSEILSDPRTSSLHDIPAVFAANNSVRRPRTQRLIQHSRESGMPFQLRQPEVEDDLEKLKAALENRQHWILGIDSANQLEEAKKELCETFDNNSN